MKHKVKNLNVTLPNEIVDMIEKGARSKDMTKSRFVQRLLEKGLGL